MSETSAWIIGPGIITMALFPFALPGIALTIVAVIPLLLLAVPVALVTAIVALAALLVRGLGRTIAAMRADKPPARVPQSS